jgi:Rps23 Pro-64 3,4-dihydroxylase Tpa1-like proline 4-hydroxylase
MTSKQILDAFSETLINDERILTPREREMVRMLLQNAKTAGGNRDTQNEVMEIIHRSIGETVANRAYALLGSSIVEHILSQEEPLKAAKKDQGSGLIAAGPQPPAGPKPTPGPPPNEPGPITPQGPQPPAMYLAKRNAEVKEVGTSGRGLERVGVLETTQTERARCVVLDEFLAPQELDQLIRYTLQHEQDFRESEVLSSSQGIGVADSSHRRSRVLMELGDHEEVILNRIRHVLPLVLDQLKMEAFPITRTEVQITASNDGDFFRAHCDDAQQAIASRQLTFVYFFHQEPRQFTGGELRLHNSLAAESYEAVVPQQNQIVFFPCSTLHEITSVRCPSGRFADSRFTVNGWLHH